MIRYSVAPSGVCGIFVGSNIIFCVSERKPVLRHGGLHEFAIGFKKFRGVFERKPVLCHGGLTVLRELYVFKAKLRGSRPVAVLRVVAAEKPEC